MTKYCNMRIVIFLASCLLLFWSQAVSAQDEVLTAPIVPNELKPYAEPTLVVKNAAAVITLLGSAKFERWIEEYEKDGRRVEADNGLTSDCDTPQYQAFYRGLHLAHAGYYLFLAKQEVGWFEYASPIGDYDLPRRRFVDFGRGVLAQLWRTERISDLHRLASELARLPADRRSDLAAFLSVLREYRSHTANLLARSAERMRDLLRRESSGYFYDHLHKRKYDKDGKDTTPDNVKGLIYSDLSSELRKLINLTRDPEVPQISECLVYGSPFRLKLGVDSQIVSQKIFVPVKYMVGFWLRRRAEGMGSLADVLLARAIEVLRSER